MSDNDRAGAISDVPLDWLQVAGTVEDVVDRQDRSIVLITNEERPV